MSCCRFDGQPVKLIPVAVELNRVEIADGRVPASEEKKLSIGALSQTLPERLMLQTTPWWSAIKRWASIRSFRGLAIAVAADTIVA